MAAADNTSRKTKARASRTGLTLRSRDRSATNLIVFIHGLGSRGRRAWGNLPALLEADLAEEGVATAFYEYESGGTRRPWRTAPPLERIVEELADTVRDFEFDGVILIGHSMGGLVAKGVVTELLRFASTTWSGRPAIERIRGLFLIATPQAGSLWVPQSACGLWEAAVLRTHSRFTTDVNAVFTDLVDPRVGGGSANARRVAIPVYAVHPIGDRWVDRFSATLGVPRNQIKVVTGAHSRIFHQLEASDDLYVWVKRNIERSFGADADSGRYLPPQSRRLPPRFVHEVVLPSVQADRSGEVADLRGALVEEATRVINLVAFGGTGKSTVARITTEGVSATENNGDGNGPAFDGVFWFEFYRSEDVDLFFLEACRYLVAGFDPSNHGTTAQRVSLLQDALADRSILLILDGFERLMREEKLRQFHVIARRDVMNFVRFLLSSPSSKAKALLTSRWPLDEFVDAPGYHEQRLDDLRDGVGAKFLRDSGVRASEEMLERLSAAYGHHALSLSVLADYVRYAGLTATPDVAAIPLTFPDETPKAQRLNTLLDQYRAALTDAERDVLGWIAVSPRGLSLATLQRLASDDTTESGKSVFGAAADRLYRSALVHRHRDAVDDMHEILDSHPLLRSYFYSKLSDGERHHRHAVLRQEALSAQVPERPETIGDIQPLLDAFWHASASGDTGDAIEIWHDPRVRLRLLWWGSYHAAYDLVQNLLESPPFRVGRDDEMHGILLDEAGVLLMKLGRPIDGIARIKEANRRLSRAPRRRLASLLHLAEAQMEVGTFRDARVTLREARNDRRALNEFDDYKLLARRSYLAAAMSPPRFAEGLLNDAIRTVDAIGDDAIGYKCLLLRIRGDLFCENGNLESASADYAAALAVASDRRWRFVDYEGHILRGQGDVAAKGGAREGATALYLEALDVARRIEYAWLEVEVLAARARAAAGFEAWTEADELARSAQVRAANGGWVGDEADAVCTLAAVAAATGDEEIARDWVGRARELADRSRRRATLRRVRDLEKRLVTD